MIHMITNKEYIQAAVRTESSRTDLKGIRLEHGAFGLVTEAGELLDNLKKAYFYNKAVDLENVKEELGDIFWYLAIICDSHGWSFEEIMFLNIEKLRKRYPKEFTQFNALHRNLAEERKTFERR